MGLYGRTIRTGAAATAMLTAGGCMEGGRISVSFDKVMDLLNGVLGLFKPMLAFIARIAGEGVVGFAVIFALFFLVHLLRWNASVQRADVFAHGLRAIGRQGLIACGLYVAALALERTLVPLIVVALKLAYNSIQGIEPGFGQFVAFLQTPHRVPFLVELIEFMRHGKSVLPLPATAVFLIGTAFGCMWFLGRVLAGLSFPEQNRRN